MKVAIISGSSRGNREGRKVSKFIDRIAKQNGWETTIIDPWEIGLPLLDKTYSEMADPKKKFVDLHNVLEEADGFILVSAEYNHSVPPALKNTLDHFNKEYNYKPSGIVCYSTGPFGGIRAGEHLRIICAVLGMSSIPTLLPISKVKESLNEDGTSVDGVYERRSQKFFKEFGWYLEALKAQREKGLPQ